MNQVIFITGASSGFGSALATLYAEAGCAVALVARRAERIETQAEALQAQGGTALPLVCDVTDRDAVRAAVAQCAATLGPIDVLIANAGVSRPSSALTFNTDDLEWMYRVNVFGAAYCFEAVLPAMTARRSGHLVGVSSLAGYRGLPGSIGYASTKAALTNMMEGLRVELRPHGVAVTTLCPGFVKTEMTANNKHPMPFLLDLEDAARRMFKAIARKDSEYAFPWQLAAVVKTGRVLPNALYDYLVASARSDQHTD